MLTGLNRLLRTNFAFRALPFVLALSLLSLVTIEFSLHAMGIAHTHVAGGVHIHDDADHTHHHHDAAPQSHSHDTSHHDHALADTDTTDGADDRDCYGCDAHCCLVFIRPPLNDLNYPAAHPVRSVWVPVAVVSTAPVPPDRPPNAIL